MKLYIAVFLFGWILAIACGCDVDFYGPNCDIYCNRQANCSNNGNCNASGTGCSCERNYYSSNCGIFCSPVGTQAFVNNTCICKSGGNFNTTGYYTYYGPSCNLFCSHAICSYSGICLVNGSCQCPTGTFGPRCQCSKTSCIYGECSSSGACVCDRPSIVGIACDRCAVDYYPDVFNVVDGKPMCSIYCSTTSCLHGDCQIDGSCLCYRGFAKSNSESCTSCAPSYYNYPNCFLCSRSQNCTNRRTCNSMGGCDCEVGWGGPSCNVCAPNYYGPNCTLFCSRTETCNGHGTCSNLAECICDVGFTGNNCSVCDQEKNYFDYPNCEYCDRIVNCSNHGNCSQSDLNCICDQNYYTRNCGVFCTDTATCNSRGVCSSAGTCICNKPYTGPNCLENLEFTTTSPSNVQQQQPDPNGIASYIVIGAASGAAFILFVFIVALITLILRRKRQKRVELPIGSDSLHNSGSYAAYANFGTIASTDITGKMEIGRGQYGIVYKGKLGEQTVAVKVLAGLFDDSQKALFLEEYKIMKSVPNHPNIVETIGMCSDVPGIVTEYVEGGSLYSFLRRGFELPQERIVTLLEGICRGLLHLHTHKVIHRDLASRNILLASNIIPKISDFGYARVLHGSTTTHKTDSSVGPVKIMAPESLYSATFSEKSDVWAFGLLMVEVVTRGDIFPSFSNAQAMAHTMQYKTHPIPNGIPNWISTMMKDCWQVNPQHRPTSKELFEELQRRSGE